MTKSITSLKVVLLLGIVGSMVLMLSSCTIGVLFDELSKVQRFKNDQAQYKDLVLYYDSMLNNSTDLALKAKKLSYLKALNRQLSDILSFAEIDELTFLEKFHEFLTEATSTTSIPSSYRIIINEYLKSSLNRNLVDKHDFKMWRVALALSGDLYTFFYFYMYYYVLWQDEDVPIYSHFLADLLVGGLWLWYTGAAFYDAFKGTTPLSTTVSIDSYLDAQLNKEADLFKRNLEIAMEKFNEISAEIKKYGKWWPYIKQKELKVGMPKEVVIKIFGTPSEIKKTVLMNEVLEEWTYEQYNSTFHAVMPYITIYIKNGYVIGWIEF